MSKARRDGRWSGGLVALGATALAVAVSGGDAESTDPTWPEVAPVVYRHCAGCHHPGGSGPFSILDPSRVANRADRIARAIRSGHMPPWLPDSDGETYVGSRVLPAGDRDLLLRWLDAGAPEGDVTAAPEPPRFDDGWALGPPDLVVDLPELVAPAEGRDIYRNLVVPIPVDEERWVRAVDLQPGNPRVVHHARMMVDETPASRRADAADPRPGFDGMDVQTGASNPPGHFVGWTPGKRLLPPQETMAWQVGPDTDLVAQLHLRLTGREEVIQGQVGFYFADEPPTEHPAILIISSMEIDIPPGESDYRISNSFTLPVPVEVLSVYPHAHYLGKEMTVTATRPGGREIELLHIPDWDFDWQDEYRLVDPVRLPAGTVIVKEFSYDNSAANPDNPNDPPKRVVFGSNSADEMGELILQVLPESEEDREALLRAQAFQHDAEDMAYMARRTLATAETDLAAGRLDEAVAGFQETLQYRSDNVRALAGLATAFAEQGDGESALFIAERAVRLGQGSDARVMAALAHAHHASGDVDQAIRIATEARRTARDAGDAALARLLETRLEGYRGGG